MAISSPLSLGKIRQSTSSLNFASKQNSRKTTAITKTLNSSIEKKKNLWSGIKLFKRRRIDFQNRISLRDKIISSILFKKPGGPRLLARSSKSTSITDRLLGFIGYASAGWILSNLPTWIALGEQFSSRLITAGSILSNYGDEAISVMAGIGNVFNSAFQNLARFDFSDSSFLVRNSLNDLRVEIDNLGNGFDEALSVLLQPFKDIPEIGSIQPDEKPETTPPPSAPSGGNADFWTLVAITSLEDSDPQGRADVAQSIYNRVASGVFPGGRNMRNVILAGNGGQYQPVERAVKEFKQIKDRETAIIAVMSAEKISRKSAEKFIDDTASAISNPTLQKNAASWVENRTDFLGKGLYPTNPSTTSLRRRNSNDNIFGTFVGPGSQAEGRKNKGPSPIPNFGSNQPTQTPIKPPPITGQRKLQSGDIFTKSLGKGVDYVIVGDLYGDPRGNRKHGGIDIQVPQGTYIALRVDCEVVFAGWQNPNNRREGYGLLIDVWVPAYGIQLRMAHLSSILINSGKIPAGTSFARAGSTGNSTGPHVHFESTTKKGSGIAGEDPDPYVRLLLLTKNPNKGAFTPAPRPSTTLVPSTPFISTGENAQIDMETNAYLNGIAEGITQERQGRKIVVIDDRGSAIGQQVISSGGGGDLQITIPDSVLLNNFIKNKLLLDLNYV